MMSEFRLPSSFLRVDFYSKNCYSALSRQELSGIGSDLDVGTNILISQSFTCLTESFQDSFLDLFQTAG
jgi:hypothetical protein